jgi:Fic family protein
MSQIYSFELDLNWLLINSLSNIDRFGGEWGSIVKREGRSLKQLKSVATVRSAGASTRIEGSKMSDDEVQALINNLNIEKLADRDEQEVLGYFEALDLISTAYHDIEISESSISSLHKVLMKYSTNDDWHRGDYKQHQNSVEATLPNGTKNIIFKTTPPGWATSDAMRLLVDWYNLEKEVHPIVRVAVFVYDFLSIHPFQDGNGRLSRLLCTLLLLREGYSWIEYVSFEYEIEHRKSEYYKVLMACQRNRPGESIQPWVMFFINCLSNIQEQLIEKLIPKHDDIASTPRVQQISMYVEHHPGARTGEIASKLGIALPTVKKEVSYMVESGQLIRHGSGAGTHYTAKPRLITKPDRMLKFSAQHWQHSFPLTTAGSSRSIKKIILAPKFDWIQPDEWVAQLSRQGLYIFIRCINRKGVTYSMQFALISFNTPYLFQPVFTLKQPIIIPHTIFDRTVYQYDYPMEVEISLLGSVETSQYTFDVLLIYDEKD